MRNDTHAICLSIFVFQFKAVLETNGLISLTHLDILSFFRCNEISSAIGYAGIGGMVTFDFLFILFSFVLCTLKLQQLVFSCSMF